MPPSENNAKIPPDTVVPVVISSFNRVFEKRWRTILEGGANEPLYQPAPSGADTHRVIFALDYVASALHEAAHWCIAGDIRRQQVDYGYWYAPDGRSDEQQRLFERVEIVPQAMEWIFAQACGLPFRVSADNLEQGYGPGEQFKDDIYGQVLSYCQHGMPERPMLFVGALTAMFSTPSPLNPKFYIRDMLD